MNRLKEIIEKCWDNKDMLAEEEAPKAIREVIALLDKGELRVAEPVGDKWQVNDWVKMHDMALTYPKG